tara:strand:+ start:1639 stop:2172 length:534 start_codon:yes stop_codon:yes gene_type:complete
MDVGTPCSGGTKVVYYRDFNLKELQYGKVIKSGLGTMKKYEPTPIRIQFPKLKAREITQGVITFEIPQDSRGFEFFRDLETVNRGRGPRPIGDRKFFNSVRDQFDPKVPIPIEMKLSQDTLYFREDNHQISRSDVEDVIEGCKLICIASSPGLWSTDKSYGNTWNVEQIKVFMNKTR